MSDDNNDDGLTLSERVQLAAIRRAEAEQRERFRAERINEDTFHRTLSELALAEDAGPQKMGEVMGRLRVVWPEETEALWAAMRREPPAMAALARGMMQVRRWVAEEREPHETLAATLARLARDEAGAA
jgi:hypothetical protein